jgi:hypothetical protein
MYPLFHAPFITELWAFCICYIDLLHSGKYKSHCSRWCFPFKITRSFQLAKHTDELPSPCLTTQAFDLTDHSFLSKHNFFPLTLETPFSPDFPSPYNTLFFTFQRTTCSSAPGLRPHQFSLHILNPYILCIYSSVRLLPSCRLIYPVVYEASQLEYLMGNSDLVRLKDNL